MARRPSLLLPLAVLVAAAAALPARADLTVVLGNGDRAGGRIDPGGETETYHVECPQGAVLSVAATARGVRAPKLHVRVTGPGDTPLADRHAKRTAVTAKLVASGGCVVEITSDDGVTAVDYDLSVRWKARRKWKDARLQVTPAAPATLAFAAGRGDAVALSVTRPRSSKAAPALGAVTGPDGFTQQIGAAAGAFVAPATGDYAVEVLDGGAGPGGKASALANVTPAAAAARVLDLAGLSTPDGSDPALIALVDASGGDLSIDLPGLEGARLSIPAGALPSARALLVGATGALTPATLGYSVAGPALSCLPEGTSFASDITITLPFDAALVGGDASKVAVTVRSGGTTTDLVDGIAVDFGSSTCAFPTSHFSEYQIVVRDPVFPPVTLDTTTLPGQTEATVATGTLGGTFRATRVNLSSFTLRVSGDGTAAPVVYATDAAGTPAGSPLWIGDAFSVPSSASVRTFQPNVSIALGAHVFVGATNDASIRAGLGGTALTVGAVTGDPLTAPADLFSGANPPTTAGGASRDLSSVIVTNGYPVKVVAATTLPSDGTAHTTSATGPRTYGGLFTARDANLVRFTLDVGRSGAAGDVLGVFVTDAPGGAPGTNVLWSTTLPEPPALARLTFEPLAYSVPLVAGNRYFLGVTIDPDVVPGTSGDGFEIRSNPNDPQWFENPLYQGDDLPLTQQGPAGKTLSTDVIMNGGR
jgi:hypothetical protein